MRVVCECLITPAQRIALADDASPAYHLSEFHIGEQVTLVDYENKIAHVDTGATYEFDICVVSCHCQRSSVRRRLIWDVPPLDCDGL